MNGMEITFGIIYFCGELSKTFKLMCLLHEIYIYNCWYGWLILNESFSFEIYTIRETKNNFGE